MTQKQGRVFDFIVNQDGGGAIKAGPDNIRRNLMDIFGTEAGDIHMIHGRDIVSTVNTWMDTHNGDNHILMIGGGDGTILSAATETMKRDVSFGIVPLGTQGFVKKLLQLPPNYVAAMKAYKDNPLRVQSLDVGRVNGTPFLYGLMIDPGSVQLFEAREEFRHGFSFKGLGKAFSFASNVLAGAPLKVVMNPGNLSVQGRIMAVTVNSMTPRANKLSDLREGGKKQVFGNMMARSDVNDGLLVLYAHPGGIIDLSAIAPKLWDGSWTYHKTMSVNQQTDFTLEASAREISVILDGEIVKAQFPMRVNIEPDALKLLRPSLA